jgi:hypothetical protein
MYTIFKGVCLLAVYSNVFGMPSVFLVGTGNKHWLLERMVLPARLDEPHRGKACQCRLYLVQGN